QPNVELIDFPDISGKTTEAMTDLLKEQGFKYTVFGEGKKVISTNVKPKEPVYSDQHILVVTDDTKMPSFIGLSKRDAFQLAQLLDLDLTVKGEGYVAKQNIKAGESIKDKKEVTIDLTTKLSEKKE